jgi:cytochrome c553
MFQLLKYFPGQLEGIAIVGLGVLIAVGCSAAVSSIRNPKRHPLNRPIASIVMILIVAAWSSSRSRPSSRRPPQAEAGVAAATWRRGSRPAKRYIRDYCAECHGEDGEGAEKLPDQPGEFTNPLNDQDFLITHPTTASSTSSTSAGNRWACHRSACGYGGALTDPTCGCHRRLYPLLVHPT